MKRIVVFVSLLFATLFVTAQDIKMTIVDGIQNQTIKSRIERGIAGLLSEINRACAQERPLQLDGIDMALSGKRSLEALWKNLHFLCEDNEIVERCLTSAEGYVIRNIYVEVNPMIEGYSDEPERALTIRLTREGQIASVAMAASYDEKDLKSIDRVFSDDAIIITGTVPMQRNVSSDMQSWREQIKYKVQNKPQYLNSLAANFNRNTYIKVTFSDVEVVRHPKNPNYYGVTLHQHWKSSTYEDDGYLLLIWEFNDGQDPIIHYRTWQPDRIGSHTLSKDEIINIMDFNIPTPN